MSKWLALSMVCLLPMTVRAQAIAVNPGQSEIIHQGFPAKSPAGSHTTSWDIHWDFIPCINKGAHVLRIVSAKYNFKDKDGQRKSVMVARNMQLAEAFTSYDDGQTCYLDLAHQPKAGTRRANLTVQLTPKLEQCVLPGEILEFSGDARLRILREVHDDGIRWLDGFKEKPGANRGYRGEKLVLLAGFQAVNYVYLTEFDFTDDGRILCRLGFTAHNLTKRDDNGGDVHVHVGCWRMDFDLTLHDGKGGPAKNDYRLISRRIDPRTAWFKVHDAAFGADNRDGEAREGKALWNAEEFTTLRVQSTEAKNAHRRPIAYDLIPMRLGSVRKLVPKGDVKKLSQEEMDFINHDFFVTHAPAEGAVQPYHKIVSLAARQRPLSGNAATVWYSSPALHVPRSEDFGPNGTNNTKGVALTTWIEFTLRPRDLFDSTPLF